MTGARARDGNALEELPAYTTSLRAALNDPGNGSRSDVVRVNRHDLAALLGDFARVSRLARLLINKRHPARPRP